MTTEYYQIPSQQGLLPLDSADVTDPWLAAAANTLSLSDWSVKGKLHNTNPPSLFEDDDAEAVSWKHVVPITTPAAKPAIKAPKVPKQFHSTSSSKIDAWSVVVDTTTLSAKQKKQAKSPKLPSVPVAVVVASPVLEVAPALTPEEKGIEDELAHQNRYKTELCKSFTETGSCRYGAKCQFAHGKEEIRPILRHPKYKTEICKTFHTTGTCPYGIRCRFIHTKSKEESILVAKMMAEEEENEDEEDSSVAPPPGIPVPKWSKSWNVTMSPVMTSKNIRVHELAEPEPAF